MDKKPDTNRPDQCNPNHKPTGPGHNAAYEGKGDKADKDNHAKNLDPNNPNYQAPKKWNVQLGLQGWKIKNSLDIS